MRSCSLLACSCICVLLCENFGKESIPFEVNQSDVLMLSLLVCSHTFPCEGEMKSYARARERASEEETEGKKATTENQSKPRASISMDFP